MTDSGGDGTILAAQCSADDTLVDTLALCKQQHGSKRAAGRVTMTMGFESHSSRPC